MYPIEMIQLIVIACTIAATIIISVFLKSRWRPLCMSLDETIGTH
ncbi:hypothetical protein [Anaerobacillus alkalilacustris]|nr:hypothetical protein [Anaerobacillus alkalilacustris]